MPGEGTPPVAGFAMAFPVAGFPCGTERGRAPPLAVKARRRRPSRAGGGFARGVAFRRGRPMVRARERRGCGGVAEDPGPGRVLRVAAGHEARHGWPRRDAGVPRRDGGADQRRGRGGADRDAGRGRAPRVPRFNVVRTGQGARCLECPAVPQPVTVEFGPVLRSCLRNLHEVAAPVIHVDGRPPSIQHRGSDPLERWPSPPSEFPSLDPARTGRSGPASWSSPLKPPNTRRRLDAQHNQNDRRNSPLRTNEWEPVTAEPRRRRRA